MKSWQHKVVAVSRLDEENNLIRFDLAWEKATVSMGAEGWELVAVLPSPQQVLQTFFAFFKREIKIQAKP